MKKYLIVLTLLFVSTIGNYLFAGDNARLRFNKDKEFKIVQFTDIHWLDKSPNCAKVEAVMKDIVKAENPDFIILTGDVVTQGDAESGWHSVAKIFEEIELPWTIILGNHDDETGISRKAIFELLESKPYFVGEKGPDISGAGNYILEVYGSDNDKVSALLYCIDSHNMPKIHNHGPYDWIHFDQIQWYREASQKYTSANNDTPLPALAFLHIPLVEYKEIEGKERTIGTSGEGVSSAHINSGMFSSLLEMNDVMGVFVGHDHDNDYIGMHNGIALAYGRATGLDTYGALEKGARTILLKENNYAFDTWITTPSGKELIYYYPSGLSQKDEEAMDYLPALKLKQQPTQQGVQYKYYEGKRYKSVDEIEKDKYVKSGVVKNFDIAVANVLDSMAFAFESMINIPERGIYRFYTFSDDGSKVYIDGKQVVDNDGSHSVRYAEGLVGLEAGWHRIKVLYFEDYMGEMLEVGIASKKVKEMLIEDTMLYLPE